MSALLDALAVLCMIGALALIPGCASGPQLSAPMTPQQVSITIDAADGGHVEIGGDVWLDARGGAASAEQQGLDVEADVDAQLSVPVSTGGAAPVGR